jgi:putative DNA primase/helicase
VPPAGVSLIEAAGIRPEPVGWLWDGWLASGKLHVLAGAPGTGKTTIALALAATLTVSGRWPDGTRAPTGSVLIWSGEDDPRDTLVPRLIATGADLSRVRFVGSVADKDGPRAFDPAQDAEALSNTLAELPEPPSLLIVDPIVSAVASDSHKNAEVRRALAPLVDLAQLRRCAVLGISHFSKGTAGRDPTERVTGSLAFGALARVVLATAKLPDEEGGGRLLARAKNNLGPDSGGFAYDLDPQELTEYPGVFATRVLWGEALEGTARELLHRAETVTDPEERTERKEAGAWLRELLSVGPVRIQEIKIQAKAYGFSERTIQRARNDIGAAVQRDGFAKGGFWLLPHSCQDNAIPAHPGGWQECGGIGRNGESCTTGQLSGQAPQNTRRAQEPDSEAL